MGVRSRPTGWSGALRSTLALCALITVGAAAVAARFENARTHAPAVYAEQSGLRLGTQALTGRVTLVASTAAAQWRIVSVTRWRRSKGHVLLRGWDTTRVSDGPHVLELASGGTTTSHAL